MVAFANTLAVPDAGEIEVTENSAGGGGFIGATWLPPAQPVRSAKDKAVEGARRKNRALLQNMRNVTVSQLGCREGARGMYPNCIHGGYSGARRQVDSCLRRWRLFTRCGGRSWGLRWRRGALAPTLPEAPERRKAQEPGNKSAGRSVWFRREEGTTP